jgi:iron complex outermembrane receptor protein
VNLQRKKLGAALAYLLGAGSVVSLSAAYAQAVNPDVPSLTRPEGKLPDFRVEVTGSNIKRVESEGALPVQVITREEVQKTGAMSALELIDKLPINQSVGNFNPSIGEGSGLVGFSAASLRGLGSNRTLVLVNGKRIAPYALSTANNNTGVDLSQIPLSVIDRVEILKDGASAVYGTDAIAGVINLITRKDYQGFELGGTYLDSEKGGGGNHQAHFVAGFGDLAKDKINAWVAIDWQEQLSLRAIDRDISKTAFLPEIGLNNTSGNSIPANITIPGVRGTKNPGFPQCLPPFSFQTPGFSAGQCRFDFAAVIDTIPPSEKTNVMGRVTWQFNPSHQAFLEGGVYRGKFTQVISPTPVSSDFTVNPVELQPGTPFYPASYIAAQGGDPTVPVRLSYRGLEFGGRSDKVVVDQYRAVGGLTGNIVDTWDYTVDLNYTYNKQVDSYVGGYLSETNFVPLLTQGTINPFGLNTPAAVQAGMNARVLGDASTNKASNYGASARITGDVWKLPAGPLAMALGTEWRRESLELINAAFLSSGDIIGGLGAIPSLPKTNRDVWAASAEVSIPIVRTLEGNVAVRYDHYSDVGGTTNPKVSLRWQPSREVLMRASYGKGFRAPSLFDLFQPIYRTNTNNSFNDPLRCDITESVSDCDLQFNSLRGGNAALKPERSTQYSVGAVWEPAWQYTQGLSIAVDYFWIEIKDVITQITADQIFFNPASFASYSTTVVPAAGYNGATYVVRRPGVDPAFPNLPNSILNVIEPTINVGKQGVDGIDIDLRYRLPAALWPTAWGGLNAGINGTYYNHFKLTQPADFSYPNFAGQSGVPYGYTQGAIPRWKHYATLDWTYGPWGVTLAETYQTHYDEPDFLSEDPNGKRTVGSYEVWDIQARFNGFKNVQLALGVRNLFDRAPPRVGDVGTFITGYDPSYGDPRGRMYYGTISVAFK